MRRAFAAIAASMFIAGIAVTPAAAKPRWGAGPPGGTVVDVVREGAVFVPPGLGMCSEIGADGEEWVR